MPIEKAFAIQAAPPEIWDALWHDLSSGEEGAYSLESSRRPTSLSIQVKLGDVETRLTYRIEQKDGFSEVAATIEPLSTRYRVYQIVTFGHIRRNFEMLLVQGLSNLKRRLEGEPDDEEEDEDLQGDEIAGTSE